MRWSQCNGSDHSRPGGKDWTSTFAANAKTITIAHAEYAKKAFQDFSEHISKLTSLKSPDEAMNLQADYAKSAYETFVAESKRISQLYTDFAKQTFRPFEGLKPHKSSCSSVKSGRAVRVSARYLL
jgi:phasin family protein